MLGLTFAQVIFTVPDNEGDAEMTVEYLYDGGDSITFTLTIDKEAWVGIGVSPRGRMENSDIMVGILGNTQSDYTVDDLGFSTGITMVHNIPGQLFDNQRYRMPSMMWNFCPLLKETEGLRLCSAGLW